MTDSEPATSVPRLLHKSVYIREDAWRTLRLHAELSGVPVRDYLTWLISRSRPAAGGGADAARDRRELDEIGDGYRRFRRDQKREANLSPCARATAE